MQRNYIQELNDGTISLSRIPPEECTEAIYLAAIQQDGMALQYIPEGKRTFELCLAAVQQEGRALQSVPEEKRTSELCLAAVQQDGSALRYASKDKRTPDLCLAAVQQDGFALVYVPEDNRTPEICLAAVQKNGSALQYVPKDKRTPDLCLAAMQEDGFALVFVQEDKRTPDLCLAAVETNTSALQFIPETYKSQVIDTLSVNKMIANNYMTTQYIADLPGYKEKIDLSLAQIEYIIIERSQGDHELSDIRLTYAHQRKQKDKTVCLRSDAKNKDLDTLLLRLQEVNNTKSLHLVLVDHASQTTDKMAGMQINDIVDICKKHPRIEHIELLGCSVVKAAKPEEEKVMIQQFSEKMAIKKKLRYGFASILAASFDDEFRKKCESFCKKNKLDGVYIINKREDGSYQLCNFKANNVFKTQDVPKNRIRDINKILENQNKALPFPKKTGKELTIRGDNNNPLTPKELKSLRALKYEENRFEKGHPKYKRDKKTYPFLAKMNVNVEELQLSFLQKIATAIEEDNDITWDVTIQGPTKALHVDTAKRDFKVTRTHLYPGSYKASLFTSQKENIDHGKLKEERRQEIEAMEKGEVTGESKAKKIKVTVRGKKH